MTEPTTIDVSMQGNVLDKLAAAYAGIEEKPAAEHPVLTGLLKGEDPLAGDKPDEKPEGVEKPEGTEPAEEKPAEGEPKVEKAAETPDEEMPEGLTDKRKSEWRELKASRDAAKASLKEIERAAKEKDRQLAELQQKVAEVEELRAKAARIEEVEKEFAIYNVEKSADYRAAVKEPLKRIEQKAAIIAKENEIPVGKLLDALDEPDPVLRRKALKEVTAELDDTDRSEVLRLASQTEELLEKGAAIRAEAAEAAKEAKANEARREAERARRAKAEFAEAVDAVLESMPKSLPLKELVSDGQTEEQFVEDLASKLKESGFDSAATHSKAFAAATAMLFNRMNRKLVETLEQNRVLESRIKDLNGRGAGVRVGEVEADKSDDDAPLEVRVARRMGLTTPGVTNIESLLANITK